MIFWFVDCGVRMFNVHVVIVGLSVRLSSDLLGSAVFECRVYVYGVSASSRQFIVLLESSKFGAQKYFSDRPSIINVAKLQKHLETYQTKVKVSRSSMLPPSGHASPFIMPEI